MTTMSSHIQKLPLKAVLSHETINAVWDISQTNTDLRITKHRNSDQWSL